MRDAACLRCLSSDACAERFWGLPALECCCTRWCRATGPFLADPRSTSGACVGCLADCLALMFWSVLFLSLVCLLTM